MRQEVVPPAFVDGALVRLVAEGEREWVQRWTGPGGWVDDPSTMIDEVLRGPTAGPATLVRFGYRPDA